MKQKILKNTLVISIIGIFLLTSLQTVSSIEIKNENFKNEDAPDYYHQNYLSAFADFHIYIDKDKIDSGEVTIKSTQLTKVRQAVPPHDIVDDDWGLYAGIEIKGPCDTVYVDPNPGPWGRPSDNTKQWNNENMKITVTLMKGIIGDFLYDTLWVTQLSTGFFGTFNLKIERL